MPRKAHFMNLNRNLHRVTFRLRRLIRLFEPAYFAQRHRLPTSYLVTCAGISVAKKPLDFLFNTTAAIKSANNYESSLVQALRDHIRPDDRVTIIGAGLGVTTALAGTLAQSVVCYEASKPYARIASETMRVNGVSNVTLIEAVVGVDQAVYGREKTDRILPPEALADCDLLEMDCEGAEGLILQQMTIRPRVIVVETHGLYGAPTSMIAELLQGLGYIVQNIGIAEERFPEMCHKHDIMCLVGMRSAEPDLSAI